MGVPKWQENVMSILRIRSQPVREFLAEFMGTFILIIFGDGSVAQSVLSRTANGGFLSVNWAWGIGVTLGAHFASGISGGHLNPAVTLGFACIGRLPWKKVPVYMLGQFLGAFIAAACVFGIYSEAIDAFDGGTRSVIGPNATAGIFATYPAEYLSVWGGFGDQVFATALLMACILAITDKKNNKPPNGMEPFIIGLVVFVIGLAYGLNCGYAINPARDFSPRLFTACAGYGKEIWTPRGIQWWWVPIVGPFLGAVIGAITYLITIEIHNTDDSEEKKYGQQELVVNENA
ncbi:aquaporin-7-like isoform X2 [Antedon mediterranea]|uniref:aquaporin-7-like isoform X2 n=1 Tax=Antedon mediterranea TaxID=105859 RepID=UPI003AF7EC1D